MGSWNGTCGISNLPIMAGQKCKLIFLLQMRNGSDMGGGFCYPTDLRSIYSFPITGIYDDYGCLEDVEQSWYTDFFLKTFKEEVASGKIKIKEEELDGADDNDSIEQIINNVERGYVSRRDDYFTMEAGKDVFVQMKFMLILDTVYQSTITMIKNYDLGYDAKHFHLRVKEKRERYFKHFENFDTVYKSIEAKQIAIEILCSIDMTLSESTHYDMDFNKLMEYIIENRAKYIIPTDTIDLATEFINMVEDFRYLRFFFGLIRKPFLEGCGSGAQTQELALYKRFYKHMLECTRQSEKFLKDLESME